MQNKTVDWFGNAFSQLHPLFQSLHTDGGTLAGNVDIAYGQGVAGIIGKRLAKKMNIPTAGTHHLSVEIDHDSKGLHWNRCFNYKDQVYSLFQPNGQIGSGYWVEKTGPLEMRLTVDIRDGGWYWRCLKVKFSGIPVPLWLIPEATAFKRIENSKYRFHVEFSLPVLGSLVRYQGLLEATQRSAGNEGSV